MVYALYILTVLVFVGFLYLPKITIKGHKVHTGFFALALALLIVLILDLTLPKEALIIKPIAFLNIHWYALWIMLGVIMAVVVGVKEGKKLGIYSDFVYTGLLITLPLSILGARLWYVLFNLDSFHSFEEVIGLKGGWSGLGIQGAVIVAITTVIIYSKCKKVPVYKAFDILAPGFLIGQILGRWGNFCNHELYGPLIQNEELFHTLMPNFIFENMYISGSYLLPGLSAGYYQPMFLYEGMLNLVGLVLILVLRRQKRFVESGDMIGFYLIWYGIVRSITESFRWQGEVLMIGGIRVSILMSVIFIVIGIAYLVIKRFVGPRRLYMDIINKVETNKIDTVIFDFDGTLMDTKRLVSQSFIHVFQKYYPELTLGDDELDSFFGPSLHESFSKYTKDEKQIERMIKDYREFNETMHDQMVRPFPGVTDTLKYLKKHGYKLAVFSAKKNDILIHGLEFGHIYEYFDLVVGGDDITKQKPDPEGLNIIIEKLDAKNALYVGDSVNDIICGKNAKIKTCGIAYKTDQARMLDLSDAEPDGLVDRMYKLVNFLGE